MTTSKTSNNIGYQPLIPGILVALLSFAKKYGWDEEKTDQWRLDGLDMLLVSQTAPSEANANFIRPGLGKCDDVVPPLAFIKRSRDICNKHGILQVASEN